MSFCLCGKKSKPHYNRNGDLASLVPADISDEVQELLTFPLTTSKQARTLINIIEVLVDNISKERSYLSRASNFPYLSSMLITCALQAHYYSGPIDDNTELLKTLFSILTLLPPPAILTDEYSRYINFIKNSEVKKY